MSKVVRVSDRAEQYIRNSQQEGEEWKEALDRLLGLNEDSEYVTEEEVEEIVERKIEEMKHRH